MTKSTEKPRRLGRGLEALIGPINQPQIEEAGKIPIREYGSASLGDKPMDSKHLAQNLREIELDLIKANPYQPRIVWNEKDLQDLADSIKANGVLQPVIVRPSGGGYEMIAGERRMKAAKMAGLNMIPAVIRQATDEQLMELALVENIHRTDLNPIERAKAYKAYLETFSLTQEEAAKRLGEDRSVIANYIRLLELPGDIKQMVIEGKLSMGHARAILSVQDVNLKEKLAKLAYTSRLSVREIERMVQKERDAFLKSTKKMTDDYFGKEPHIVDLEKQLTRDLGAKVTIDKRKKRQAGKIIIEFYSLDEFERILERMGIETAEEV